MAFLKYIIKKFFYKFPEEKQQETMNRIKFSWLLA